MPCRRCHPKLTRAERDDATTRTPTDARSLIVLLQRTHPERPATPDDLATDLARLEYAAEQGQWALINQIADDYGMGD